MKVFVSCTYIDSALIDFIYTTPMHPAMLPLTSIAIPAFLPNKNRKHINKDANGTMPLQ